MAIEVRNIVKRFGSFAALDNVDLKVADGELLALLGPSGSGKTTLLRIIAGLDWPDSGEVAIDGENALSRGASERQVGFVFQHYALFRHMTVFENVAFGLRVQPRAIRKDEATIRARVKNLLDLVQLDWLANRYPSQLSGGQRQRIALARALAIEPRILLLDEPFGALDPGIRADIHVLMKRLWNETHLTVVMVTHDLSEAFGLATRVIALERSRNRPEERERYGATVSRDLEIFPRRSAEPRAITQPAPIGTTRSGKEHQPGRPGALVLKEQP